MATDYYKTLGISRDASQADIQKAYRKLARKYHPDVNPDDKGAKQKFQEVQKAFDVLNDTSKRELYDRYGSSFESMGAGGGPRGGGSTWTGGAPGGFEDVDLSQFFGDRYSGDAGSFGDIFSQFRRASPGRSQRASAQPRRGADITAELHIPLTTAVQGGEAQLTLARKGGKMETITVKIPRGIEDGKKIRLRGQGEPNPRGTPGDVLITVHVAPHPHFQRRGNNLELKLPVTLAEAALGAKVDVPTPNGVISLRIPPGSSGGARLRIKGHGVTPQDGPPGDLFAEVQIVLPKTLDDESLELIRRLDAHNEQNRTDPRRDLRW